MTQENYTHITLLLDESGSMAPTRDETVFAVNQFIAKQKELEGKCTLSLVTFAHDVNHRFQMRNVKDIETVDKHYDVYGWTALYDALGQAIERTGKVLSEMREGDRPSKVLFVVLTDGQENSSHQFDKQTLARKIKHQETKYSWDFVFLGADFDAFSGYGNLGVKASNYASFSKEKIGKSMQRFASNVGAYHLASRGDKESINLTNGLDAE